MPDDVVTVTTAAETTAEDLQGQIGTAMTEVERLLGEGDRLADPEQSNWQGPDHDAWADEWSGQIRTALENLATELDEIATWTRGAIDEIFVAAGRSSGL